MLGRVRRDAKPGVDRTDGGCCETGTQLGHTVVAAFLSGSLDRVLLSFHPLEPGLQASQTRNTVETLVASEVKQGMRTSLMRAGNENDVCTFNRVPKELAGDTVSTPGRESEA
jgi:hypothetical protein